MANQTLVYTLEPHPKRLAIFDTWMNSFAIYGLSESEMINSLALTSQTKGQVLVIHHLFNPNDSVKRYKTGIIVAHTSRISCLAVSSDGTLLASASEKGTLGITIVSLSSPFMVHEYSIHIAR